MMMMRSSSSSSAALFFNASSSSTRVAAAFVGKTTTTTKKSPSSVLRSTPRATMSVETINSEKEDASSSSSSSSSSTATALVALRCAFRAELSVGETLVVVGSTPLLGEWKAEDGFKLSWTEGNVWKGNLPVEREEFEFKLVVEKTSGETYWEKGENRKINKTIEANTVEVKSTFGTNEDMEVSFMDGVASPTVQSNVVDFAREEEKKKEENVVAKAEMKKPTKSTKKKKAAAAAKKTTTGAYRTVEKVKYDNFALLKFDELMEKNSMISMEEFKAIYPEDVKMKAVEKRTVEFLLKGGGGKFSYALNEEAKGYAQLLL